MLLFELLLNLFGYSSLDYEVCQNVKTECVIQEELLDYLEYVEYLENDKSCNYYY